MSRELWLMRHGKAERYDGIEDYDRPLKKRGKRDAKLIGEWLKNGDLIPDLVISSPAIRAIATAKWVCQSIGSGQQQIQMEKRLYDEGLTRVKAVLADCPQTLNRVLLVGHNPELEELLIFLLNDSRLPSVDKLFPTATLARLSMPGDWSQLTPGCAELLAITYPKQLAEALPGAGTQD